MMPSIGPHKAGKVLGGVGSSTGFLLSLLGQECMRGTRAALAEHGLKPRQLRILDLLDDRGPTGQRELSDLMAIDQSILVNMLNPLEVDGLVKRERDAADRRRHVVTITPAGTQRLGEADKAFRNAEEAYFAALTEAQRRRLHALLLALREAGPDRAETDCE